MKIKKEKLFKNNIWIGKVFLVIFGISLIFGVNVFQAAGAVTQYGSGANYMDGCGFIDGGAVTPGLCVSPCHFNADMTTCSMTGSGSDSGWDVNSVSGFGLPDNTISAVAGFILSWLLGILGILGILGFLLSGSMYLLAAGDEDVIKRAKRAMTFSIIGIVVGMMGLIVFNVIYNILNASGNL